MPPKVWYALAVILVCIFGTVVFNVWYTNKVARDTLRQHCGVVSLLSDRSLPITTERGRAIVEAFAEQAKRFDCPPAAPLSPSPTPPRPTR